MADTMKQVQLEHRRLMENNSGATESSRAALSAISGRNVLKTKKETEKIKRNEEIAAKQTAAMVAQGSAAGAVTMEKAKLSAAQQGEDLQISKEKLEWQKKNERKGQALSMLNMGIYDPDFVNVLGMPESVVKTAAENKAAEIQARKNARNAAAKAQAEYEQALKDLNNAKDEEEAAKRVVADLTDSEKEKISSVFDQYNNSTKEINDADSLRDQILEESGVLDVVLPLNPNYGLPSLFPNPKDVTTIAGIRMKPSVEVSKEEIEKKKAEQKEKERMIAEAQKRKKQMAVKYYEQLLNEKIAMKNKYYQALTALEESYSKSASARLSSAREKVSVATTEKEWTSAYEEYIKEVNFAVDSTFKSTGELFDSIAKQMENAEKIGTASLTRQKNIINTVVGELETILKSDDISIEFQDALQETVDQLNTMASYIDECFVYEETYEENKDLLKYEAMDRQYGGFGIEELEALLAEKKAALQRAGGGALDAYSTAGMTREEIAAEQIRRQELQGGKFAWEIEDLEDYLKKRKNGDLNQESYQKGKTYLDEAHVGHITDQLNAHLQMTREAKEQFYKGYEDEVTYADMNSEEGQQKIREASTLYNQMTNPYSEMHRDAMMYYTSEVIPYNERLFSNGELKRYADEMRSDFNFIEFQNIGGEFLKYKKGREGVYEGDYERFYVDIPLFVKGKYGDYTEEEANRVLAIMKRYGADAAFDYYAAVTEQVQIRRAEKLNVIHRTGAGLTSGLANFFKNGGNMLENALNGDYARIKGNIFTASHQVTMEKIDELGPLGEGVGMLYMAGYSVIDMLPAVALSFVPVAGPALSSGYTFAKVMATTYNDSILQGKRADEALTYSILSATAEVGMEKLLGTGGQTFAKTGAGKYWKEAVENLSSTNAMKMIIKTAGSMGSEGFEEFLQECLSPFLEKVAADLNGIDDATLKEIDWEEAAKSFAIGALTGSVFGGFEAISSTKNAGMKESEARALLESGEVAKVIKGAAQLGNRRAAAIMNAKKSGKAIYQDQSGWFAYASPADVVNVIQSTKRKSVKQSMRILQEKYNARQTEPEKRQTFDRLFKKILQGNTLTLQETAEIINDPEMAEILNEMLGMDVTMMLPNEVLAVAKLVAFAENGKISQERLALFKDAFGDLDIAAIEQIIKYSDMAAKKVSGIIYENATGQDLSREEQNYLSAAVESQLSEAEQEAAEVLKILSSETGVVFLVTDQHETGTYLSANMMAVRRGDLANGVFKTAVHRAYYMAKQMLADTGVNLKTFLLDEVKKSRGEDGFNEEIKNILRQSAENGNDISNPTAEDELCARMLGELLQQEGVLEQLAEADLDIVNALRKAFVAIEAHLGDQITSVGTDEKKDPTKLREQELRDLLADIKNGKINKGQNIPVRVSTPSIVLDFAKEMAFVHGEKTELLKNMPIFMPTEKARQALAFEEEWDGNGDAHEFDVDDMVNIIKKMNEPSVLVYEGSTGRIVEVINYKTEKSNKVLAVIEFNEFKGAEHTNGYKQGNYQLLVTLYPVTDKVKYDRMLKNKNNVVRRMEKEKGVSQLTSGIHVPSVLNDSPFYKFSISNPSENVNHDSEFLFFDSGAADVSGIVDRLTQLIKQKRAEKLGYHGGNQSDSETEIDLDAEKEITVEEVFQAYDRVKDAEKNYERELRRNLLTDFDKTLVDSLIRGEITPEELDGKTANKAGVLAVYQMKAEKEKCLKTIRDYKKQHRAALFAEADSYLETANAWRDKRAGIAYEIETMERNVEDIVPDQELASAINKRYFEPVHKSAAEANRLKTEYRKKVQDLELSRKVAKGNEVSEAAAVQICGEAMSALERFEQGRVKDNKIDGKTQNEWQSTLDDLWENNPNLDRQKIERAVDAFREIYDDLFKQMNEVRVRNGYEPVQYRQGYFLHFRPGETDGVLALFGKALGIGMEVDALPTTISGLTHMFKPGTQWFGSTLQRLGYETVYDAVEGFDKYIEGVADVICQTDNIQALRAFATRIRYRTSDEGLQAQMNAIFNDESLEDVDKQNRIKELNETGRFTLSKFVVHLDEYTNLLANKKARGDREAEHRFNRSIYRLVQKLESRVGANMVVGNIGSWFTNIIPLNAGFAELGSAQMLKAMHETTLSYKKEDGFWQRSTFLTNRRGSDPIVRTWTEKTSNTLNSPMEFIDHFVADSLVRARYQANLEKGMSEEAAMEAADDWAARVMADRSKGGMATVFSQKHPILKLFTQFQIEVQNQVSYIFKDLPREYGKKGAMVVTSILLKFFLAGFLYDEVYEYFKGYRPAFDPFGIINDMVGDVTGYQLPNLVELAIGVGKGDLPSFKTEKEDPWGTIINTGKNVLEQVPFVGGVFGGGRLPISSALPNWENLGKALFGSGWSAKKRGATIIKELSNPALYLATPFAGGQLKRAIQGVKAVIEGGSYTVNINGEDILQYPVYNDSFWDTAKNGVQAVLLGKSALSTAQRWVDNGFNSLNKKETACYQGMLDVGVSGREAFALINDLRAIKKTEKESADVQKRRLLSQASISGEAKAVVYYGLLAEEDEQELIDRFLESDTNMDDVVKTLISIKDAGNRTGAGNTKRKALLEADLTDAEKIAIYQERITTDHSEEIEDLTDAGLNFDQYLQYKNNTAEVDGESVSTLQKYQAIDGLGASDDVKLSAAMVIATKSDQRKLSVMSEFDVGWKQFITVKENIAVFDGIPKNTEVRAAIDLTDDLSNVQKAVLWQLFTGSTSAKNNPYSVSVGNMAIALDKQYKAEHEE